MLFLLPTEDCEAKIVVGSQANCAEEGEHLNNFSQRTQLEIEWEGVQLCMLVLLFQSLRHSSLGLLCAAPGKTAQERMGSHFHRDVYVSTIPPCSGSIKICPSLPEGGYRLTNLVVKDVL